jgi:hypothetical protein
MYGFSVSSPQIISQHRDLFIGSWLWHVGSKTGHDVATSFWELNEKNRTHDVATLFRELNQKNRTVFSGM